MSYNIPPNNNIIGRMSVTLSNCDEICTSPTNNSKSKMLYTFSKGERFSKRRVILCDKFYNVESAKSARVTGLGYGTKYDFTKNVPKYPSPNKYDIKSDFLNSPKKGFGFGYGRNEMQMTGPFVQTKLNKNPGPGNYPHKSELSQGTFSIRGKSQQEDQQKLKIPGPGTYPVSFNINESGKYFLSKFKNSCVRNFNGHLGRVGIEANKLPGPGTYDKSKTDLSPDGKYFNSKMHSSLVRKFGTSQRSNIVKKVNTPGPGNYRIPSQFGYYAAKSGITKPMTQGRNRSEDKQNLKIQQ